jgi:exopolyphosphatase/guanosine-5'-triphosphate,3'-diphosphate pyrophosphatase
MLAFEQERAAEASFEGPENNAVMADSGRPAFLAPTLGRAVLESMTKADDGRAMTYEQIAAVDLGSNTFRLQVGRVVDDQIYPLDTLKETVRLAFGLSNEKVLDEVSQERALVALSLFAERLRGFAPESVRAVATNTLRVAKNSVDFIRRAEGILGFPIEVIGGREEARLIYLGAAHALPAATHKRLVIDIGGGSTEFIIGRKLDQLVAESLFMGCVSYSGRFFPYGAADRKSFAEAEVLAAREVETIVHDYRRVGWGEVIATSGTARAISDVLEANAFNPDGGHGITPEGLSKLRAAMIRAGSAKALKLAGLRVERLPVLAGGVAIMSAIFSVLGIERMTYSVGALRLGVLYDLLGRFQHHDMRDATVDQFRRRYHVEAAQVVRVEETAIALFEQLADGLYETPVETEADAAFLRWAVALHEVGISIAHNAFHKHGAYIVRFADMPGFSKKDQERLAFVLLGQRGKLDKLPNVASSDPIWRLVFCLRTAALLHRSRSDEPLPAIFVKAGAMGFQIELPADWLHANPLTTAALADEMLVWPTVGLALKVKRRGKADLPARRARKK